MKGCLVKSPKPSSFSTSLKRPPNVKHKSVSFFGSSESEEEQERVQVYEADDWDRTPCEVTHKLSYKDILELYELKYSLPRSSASTSGFDTRAPTLLKGVPVALLPLIEQPEQETPFAMKPPNPSPSPHLPSSSSSSSSSPPPLPPLPSSGTNSRFKFKFVPLMQSENESQSTHFSPRPVPTRSGLRNFQFLPIYNNESQSDDDHDDHDQSTSSPVSTPSLTSSSVNSPPTTPSGSPSPSLTPSISSSISDSYFDYPLRQPRSIHQVDFCRLNEAAGVDRAEASPISYAVVSKKLTLHAMPSPNLLPPSPFDLQGSLREGRYLERDDKLGDYGFERKRVGKRFAGTGHDDEDE